MEITIRSLQLEDLESVLAIHKEGILTGNATFEKSPPSKIEWDNQHLKAGRLVSVMSDHGMNDQVVGWAALSPISDRFVYSGVCDVSIYVKKSARGKGIGKKLLSALITESEKAGYWTLQSRIFPENHISLSIHKKLGFKIVGRREKIGKIDDIWRDILLLERRSTKIGI
jgi:phosphinothricin acetyltransferase